MRDLNEDLEFTVYYVYFVFQTLSTLKVLTKRIEIKYLETVA